MRDSLLARVGLGYRTEGQLFVDPTALGLLALAPTRPPLAPATTDGEGAAPKALRTLLSWQKPEGFFGALPDDTEPSWATSSAILALHAHGHTSGAGEAARWLASSKTPAVPPTPETDATIKRLLKIDTNIPGWAWWGNQFAAVEPTSLACLALRAAGGSFGRERIAQGMDYFRDRKCSGGGWNYGNPHFFDANLPPICLPTAKAVLAVSLCGGTRGFALDDSVAVLSQLLKDNASRKTHAWGALAFAALGRRDTAIAEALRAVDCGDGAGNFGGGPDATAVSVLALRAALGEAPECLSRVAT